MSGKDGFLELLERSSAQLHADHPDLMDSGDLIPTPNEIHEADVALFDEGMDAGLITVLRGGRFNTLDRPTPTGHWGLLSRSRQGGWYNAEYLPQIAAYVDAIVHLGYPAGRVLFELPGSALQLDLAILDDDGRVVVLGEVERVEPCLERGLELLEAPLNRQCALVALEQARGKRPVGDGGRRAVVVHGSEDLDLHRPAFLR